MRLRDWQLVRRVSLERLPKFRRRGDIFSFGNDVSAVGFDHDCSVELSQELYVEWRGPEWTSGALAAVELHLWPVLRNLLRERKKAAKTQVIPKLYHTLWAVLISVFEFS